MSRWIRSLVLAVCLLTPGAAFADENAEENARLLESAPNGCGAGWTIYLVPDSLPLFHCSFREACDAHDDCYGKCAGREGDPSAPDCGYLRCKPGGDLYQSTTCTTDFKWTQLALKAQSRRGTCDRQIGKDIVAANLGKAVCIAFSFAYERAVKSFGETHFRGFGAKHQIRQSKEDYEAAIREFFRNGTQTEFEAFNANPPSFDEDLKYVPGEGLVNIKHAPLGTPATPRANRRGPRERHTP